MDNPAISWRWEMGSVNKREENIEIQYGSIDSGQMIPVAFIGPPHNHKFTVQFLIDKFSNIYESVLKEINFCLIEKNESDPWAYVKYHCATSANLYSSVHLMLKISFLNNIFIKKFILGGF